MDTQQIKLYEYDYAKPDLSEDFLEHFGVKGMHWGIRKDGKPQGYQGSGRKRRAARYKQGIEGSRIRKSKRTYKVSDKTESSKKSKEQIIEDKDIKEMDRRKDEFTTKEINDVLNRINTEQRLSDLANKNPAKEKTMKVVNTIKKHPALITIPIVTMYGVIKASQTYKQGIIPDTPGATPLYISNFLTDFVDAYKKGSNKSSSTIKKFRSL